MHKHFSLLAALLGLAIAPVPADAQKPFVGAGVGVSSIPRSRAPLCGSARRLTGPAFIGVAGVRTAHLRVAALVDVTQTLVHDAADCVPRSGVSVDSVFAQANTSAWTAGANISFQVATPVSVVLGAGVVPDHRSWFLTGGMGAQYRVLRTEIVARWHRTSFDTVTRDFTEQGVREISQVASTETSWGAAIRLLIVTR